MSGTSLKPSIILFGLLLTMQCVKARGYSSSDEPKPLFASTDLLTLEIRTGLDSLLADRDEEGARHPGTMRYMDSDGSEGSFPVELETRGNFRRREQNCDFPPLMLRMEDEQVKETLFEGQDRLKLVTHCRTGEEQFSQFVLKEYLIYRWYNALTPKSYLARLVRVRYFEGNAAQPFTENFGILIERTRDMADRNGCDPVDFFGLHPNRLSPYDYTLLSLFEYLIRNNDWSVEVLHNVKLITGGPDQPLFPVGYDFDWAGLIQAPYRVLSVEERQEGITEFRGFCSAREEMYRAMDRFIECRDLLYGEVRNLEYLGNLSEAMMLEGLDTFFTILESPARVREHFLRNCK